MFWRADEYVYRQMGLFPDFWQHQWNWRWCSKIREYLDCRTRGGSKTHDGAVATCWVLLLEPATDAGWFAGASQQLTRAMTYFRRIQSRTALGEYFRVARQEITNIPMLLFDNDSEMFVTIHGTSGPRAALQVYDEEGKVRKKDIVLAMEEAAGTKFGARGRVRIRHITTLGLGTPAEAVYNRLDPLGLVYRRPPDVCSWIDPKDILAEEASHPRWYMNLEHYCKVDAPGGRIIKFLDVFDTAVPLQGGVYKGGIDWNPVFGNVAVVKYQVGRDDYIVDEIVTHDLDKLAVFIAWWEYYHGAMFISEVGGGDKIVHVVDLRVTPVYLVDGMMLMESEWHERGEPNVQVVFPRIAGEEYWTVAVQYDRVARIEAKSARGHVHAHARCKTFVSQANRWHFDEKNRNGLPAHEQEDHACDAYAHTDADVPVPELR